MKTNIIGLFALAPFLTGVHLSAQTPTVGGGTLASPAIGPAPAYNYEYGSLINGAVLVKNWDFGSGAGNTVHNISEMSSEFFYHDQYYQIANNGSYGSKTVSPDLANSLTDKNQPIQGVNTAGPVREFFGSSLKTYLVPLDNASVMNSDAQNVGNGSFMAKWTAPNGGSILGMDIIWETRVRYVTPPYFWFAIWAAGNAWGVPNSPDHGAEMDVVESFGYNNGGPYTNFDGHAWHVDVIGDDKTLPPPRSQEESDYVNGSWGNLMADHGVTTFDATQWHTWTWVYRADNSFTVYLDGSPVQRGQTWWTAGARPPDATYFPINMSFLFDGAWSNNQVGGLKGFTIPASDLVGKYYEWDYSRVYYRTPTTNDIKNLALNATVTGFTSQETNNPVSHMINNIYNNNADRWSPVSAGYPNYFELDLGGNKQVVSTELMDVVGASFKYKIEMKPDGGTYSTVVDQTAGTSQSPIQADTFSPTTARFVKVTITGSANSTSWIGIREFRVMGSDVAGAPPSANLALGKPTTFSSVEYTANSGNYAVDGNSGTRWSSNFTNDQWIYVDLGASYSISRVKLNWEGAYASGYKVQVSNDASNWTDIYSTGTGDGGIDDLTGLSGMGRYVRVLGVTRATVYGISLWDFEVYGAAAGGNSALGKTATASSMEYTATGPNYAVDGNSGTRWSSNFTDNQWIYVDLESVQSVSRVKLKWEGAYASAYKIQTSTNATTWTDLGPTITSDGGIDDITGLSGSGRYVRILGVTRATVYGISLWDFEVYP